MKHKVTVTEKVNRTIEEYWVIRGVNGYAGMKKEVVCEKGI